MSEDRSIDSIREQKLDELRSTMQASDETTAVDTAQPVQVASGTELSELVDQHNLVLADFYADWCGPCKMIEPVVAELAAETSATVAKIDIDDNQALAAKYGVRGVPTLLLFVEGDVAEQLVGVQEKDKLESLINRYGS